MIFFTFRGFEVEEHSTFTKDGYMLILHRIPARLEAKGRLNYKKPVLFMHGCMLSSECWVALQDKDRGLPYLLSSMGYDVWLGNNRGNRYCNIHSKYKPSDPAFWDFSIDEMALYDVPAMVDYILEETRFKSLTYIGFSQGTAQCFASLSINKELNSKINHFIALAGTTKPHGNRLFNFSL